MPVISSYCCKLCSYTTSYSCVRMKMTLYVALPRMIIKRYKAYNALYLLVCRHLDVALPRMITWYHSFRCRSNTSVVAGLPERVYTFKSQVTCWSGVNFDHNKGYPLERSRGSSLRHLSCDHGISCSKYACTLLISTQPS